MKKNTLIPLTACIIFTIFCFQVNGQSKTEKHRTIDYNYTGELNKNDLLNSSSTARWFKTRLNRYEPDTASIKTIRKYINEYTIEVYMGIWCPDSRREVPRLYKILEKTNYNMDNLTLYTLNHAKKAKSHIEKGKDIVKVPTIIFYKDGKEVNRFVENSRESLPKDIAKIVSGETYKNIYAH